MSNITYSDSQKKECTELYQDKSLTLEEISELTGVPRSTISKYAKEAGLPLRHQRSNVSITRARTCKHCGKSIKVLGAKFCPFCGNLVLSKKEIAKEAIDKLKTIVQDLPILEKESATITASMIAIIDYVENSKEIK